MTKIKWIALAVFIGFVIAGLIVATATHLHHASFWILTGVFAALGLIGAGVLLWWRGATGQPADGPAGGEKEIDFLLRQADAKLRSSRLGRQASIGSLPLVLVAGETGFGKTTVVESASLEPELLAGQVSQDGKIIPTRSANVWLARGAVFAEAAGGLLREASLRSQFLRLITPHGISSVLGSRGPAPRVAVVCVSCESFLQGANPAETLNALRPTLEECARKLGTNLPLYVLFTKFDQVQFFAEYAENFTPDEAGEIFGATLPPAASASGIYAEEETRRLSAAFDELFCELSDGRIEFLGREHNSDRLPRAYEFPREFRKLRSGVVQFLVELCRPSQLTTSPFLRGFYFTGKRTVALELEPEPEKPQRQAAAVEEDLGATHVISSAQIQRLRAQSAGQPGATHVFDLRAMAGSGATRSVEQPVFLSRLFNEIVLKDAAGLGAKGSSARVSSWRRALATAAAIILLIFCAGFIVSFLNNRALRNKVDVAITAAQTSGPNAPLDAQLQHLESLRKPLLTIGNYNRNGAPFLTLGWWLYSGRKLYPKACSAYAQEFRQTILNPAQSSLVSTLRGLPSSPTGDYGTAYDALRAYLITTTSPAESRRAFLTPQLFNVWSSGRTLDPQEEKLATAQLDFYSDELQQGGASCFASQADQDAVAHARAYLNQFPPEERVYRAMLADAAKSSEPVVYSRSFPNANGVVAAPVEIAGPYTKEGWVVMQKDLANPQPFMKGEPWVLGTQVTGTADVITLQQHLRQRYLTEYASAWRQLLASAKVLPYSNLSDASRKLASLTGNTSPLLELFWLVSNNVSPSPELLKEFQPVAKVVPPTGQAQYVSPANQSYLGSLLSLKTAVDQFQQQPQTLPAAGAANPVSSAASQAMTTASQIAQGFTPDPAGHVDSAVQRLLLEPITNIKAALPKPGEALNGKGRSFCGQVRSLLALAPFSSNPRAPAASPAQFAAIFGPNGAISAFYTQDLASVLTFAGSAYVVNPASPIKINPEFLRYFNRISALSRAFYPNGSAQPQLRFLLSPLPPQGVKQFSVTIDGQTMAYPGGGAVQITWSPAAAGQTTKTVDGGSINYQGPWGAFSLFGEATWKPAAAGYDLTWVQKSGNQILRLPNGQPETSGVHLDMMGAPPVFEPGYFRELGCVARVAE